MIYECCYCENIFKGCSAYVRHMKNYGSEKIERFKCVFGKCFKTLSSSSNLFKHLKFHELKGENISVS